MSVENPGFEPHIPNSKDKITARAATVLFDAVRSMVTQGQIDPGLLRGAIVERAVSISDVGNPRRGVEYFTQATGNAEDIIVLLEESIFPPQSEVLR